MADLASRDFRIAVGRRRIAVDRAEIALPVDQRQPERKILRHAHQRVIDRQIAMRMIFAHDIADDARRFLVRLVGRKAVLIHRVEDAPVHRLQAVAHIGQSAAHDHAHRVIEVAFLHLIFDGDERNFTGIGGRNHAILVVFVGHEQPLTQTSGRFKTFKILGRFERLPSLVWQRSTATKSSWKSREKQCKTGLDFAEFYAVAAVPAIIGDDPRT